MVMNDLKTMNQQLFPCNVCVHNVTDIFSINTSIYFICSLSLLSLAPVIKKPEKQHSTQECVVRNLISGCSPDVLYSSVRTLLRMVVLYSNAHWTTTPSVYIVHISGASRHYVCLFVCLFDKSMNRQLSV